MNSYMYIRELITKLMNNGLEKKAAIIKQRFKEVTGVDIVDYKLLNLKEGDLICAIQGKTEGYYYKGEHLVTFYEPEYKWYEKTNKYSFTLKYKI